MPSERSGLTLALLLVCGGIAYGSLYPFNFSAELDEGAIGALLGSWNVWTSRGDRLGNIALFFPYGYLAGVLALRSSRIVITMALVICGAMLALLCQVLQMYTPGRDPSLTDLFMNGAGAAAGWLVGRFFPLGTGSKLLGADPRRHMALAVAACWLLAELLPLVPSIDWQAWKASVAPLRGFPHAQWQLVVFHGTAWLACLYLLHYRAGFNLRRWRCLALVATISLLKVVIVANTLKTSATLGLFFASLIWCFTANRPRESVLALGLLLAFSLAVIAPWMFREAPRDFGWLPFGGYLHGSMLTNATGLCRKLFVFGALYLLFVQHRARPVVWLGCFALVFLGLEVAQRWIGYGTPALTDPLLFMLLGLFLHRQKLRYRKYED